MAESVFLECNAIHVPVQCKVNAYIGALFKLMCIDLVHCKHFAHIFGLLEFVFVYFGAWFGLSLGLTIVLKLFLIPVPACEYWHRTCSVINAPVLGYLLINLLNNLKDSS